MTDAGKKDEKTGLKKLLDSVAGTGADKASWPATVFLLSLFVLILSFLGIKLALAKRKAAELAAQLRLQQEVAKAAKEDEKMAHNAEEREYAQGVIKETNETIVALQDEIYQRKIEHDDYVRELESVSSWDDIIVVDSKDPNA